MAIRRADQAAIREAANCLCSGGLVAFPTETVYGLGADATAARAVARIFEAKGRPTFNPLIVHVADQAVASQHVTFTPLAEALAEAFWPGGLTLVLEKSAGAHLSDLVSAGLSSAAIRVPSHPVARALLDVSGCPVAAPSANRSGHVSATTAEHVAADLGDYVDIILDDGPSPLGLESTIVDARGSNAIVLRHGAITIEAIAEVVGRAAISQPVDRTETVSPRTSPGQLESHYAPASPIRLTVTHPRPGEALLAFGADVPDHDGPTINLSPAADLLEAAANLFQALRELDALRPDAIAAMPIPHHGLGRAINDRLTRAAAPRPKE